MKFWIWSDLHLEQQKLELPGAAEYGADAIICAGDLCHAVDLADCARSIVERFGMPMVFVPGNHEFYRPRAERGRSLHGDRVIMQEAQEASRTWKHRLYVLDDAAVCIGGVRIVGGTLWTDFGMGAEDGLDIAWRMNECLPMMPDFGRIKMSDGQPITPLDMLDMHRATRTFIKKELAVPFAGRTVVVTHHLPYPDCTPEIYRGGKSNYLFACGEGAFGDLMGSECAPALWVCGHTHHPSDVTVGKTRIVCNPFGYMAASDERDNGFRWDFVIDVKNP